MHVSVSLQASYVHQCDAPGGLLSVDLFPVATTTRRVPFQNIVLPTLYTPTALADANQIPDGVAFRRLPLADCLNEQLAESTTDHFFCFHCPLPSWIVIAQDAPNPVRGFPSRGRPNDFVWLVGD